MRVLVACEFSGRVRDAFLKRGHEAMSCDLLPSDAPGPHYQGDVFDVIDDGWDLMIAHPPCTYLTCAAEWLYSDSIEKKLKQNIIYGEARKAERRNAIDFVIMLYESKIKHIAIENPVGVLSTAFRKPDQIIQPYQFGNDASKKTCLWLKNLPGLIHTKYIPPRFVCCGKTLPNGKWKYDCPVCYGAHDPLSRWGNQTNSGQNMPVRNGAGRFVMENGNMIAPFVMALTIH